MNDKINRFLLAGDKFLPEMHLREPGSTYSACGQFTKSKKRIQKFKQTGDLRYIYKNDSVLRDKAFNIAKDRKYDGYQRGLASMIYKLFDKKTPRSAVKSTPQNEQLADELHKPIIRKF